MRFLAELAKQRRQGFLVHYIGGPTHRQPTRTNVNCRVPDVHEWRIAKDDVGVCTLRIDGCAIRVGACSRIPRKNCYGVI